MQKWEYLLTTAKGHVIEGEDLNRWGHSGWELCSVIGDCLAWKRPVGPDWKARCEAAEAVIDALETPFYMEAAYAKWKELKNKPS